MAAYINRTMSMIAGENQFRTNDIRTENSPLQIFVKAKKKINDIFLEIDDYVDDTVRFIGSLRDDHNIISPPEVKKVESYTDKVQGIRDVLKRDHMKVAFFGRTSNGKSTVINAMLRDKILPSGIGHTTNCFLQVEGSEGGEAYLVTEASDAKQPVQSVGQLGHALCKEKLCESNLVRIFWPKDKCLLLRDDVVFVDSPGVDVTPNLDDWIDKHCLDADVFVLVANAESTLMIAEKNFFHKVSTKLSKPNIFILNNRWDASASEPEFLDELVDEQKEVRAQHQERAVDFLAKELKVCNPKDAEERVFFISAKETLQARLQEARGQPAHNGALAEGFQNRYFEFQDFERKFEECISKSAVKTKFEQHSQRGKHIATEIRQTLDEILERTQKMKSEQVNVKKEVHDKLNFTEQQLMILTQEMKDKIHRMVEDVEQRVSKALNEEIRRLAVLVDEFSVPFHPEPLVLNVYKRELHVHVENGLGSNLRARLSTALALNIENSQREMTERMSCLLPENKRQMSLNVMPRREPFEILYRLNCDNLCADFHEDLEFRFSWGITALINRFAGKQSQRLAITNLPQEIPQSLVSPADSIDSSKFVSTANCFAPRQDDWSLATRVAIASITSQGTMGGLIVAGFMLKTVGWRLIAVTGAIYGALYMYERLTWTNKAKEREFKRQYVSHATKKLKLIVDLTSANCSHQVQQELSSTFARLCHLVDETTSEMDSELKTIATTLRTLEEAATNAKVLRNKANYLANELDLFDAAYLKSLH
ncbi:transmembrane GTPase Marf isoform X1 [Nasonia vitripennis]|uniref:Dynamin-type G domain-containing protein n=2 Tax=Nasonia vitripennis TaxID=7425 RepID=A0A7M7QSP6_NASVI|nr:transmembrane GTPase Marf isoform X1 [Nasonia vitripennis]XP_016839955.1 transmembrane GTPase Marf isoform X1 [Nasonia vitripennis]XP_016839956.1 transmembrane GTPase Marf isoform X1 [Nasonia vitripennis]XP_016839957.1 transmembrane GTPase Marf isoform X1 [Nasonia vitripennis]XP_016839958.1 transmembrane GTPase Marf isoform X1 [Nasonia vitripennis]XP_031783427.1 transmembrane GTPase Marf isoform X1 [Nasonia vitripennis]XP_032454211.1 transmembrane GTPase Marf isoform X1 [Nasonia vitripenni